jgi:hypothetical protein
MPRFQMHDAEDSNAFLITQQNHAEADQSDVSSTFFDDDINDKIFQIDSDELVIAKLTVILMIMTSL